MLLLRMFVLLVVVSPSLMAGGLGVRLSEDYALVEYFSRSDTLSVGTGGADINYAFFYNDNNDVAITAKLLAAGNIEGTSRALSFAVGGKAYVGVFDDMIDDALGAIGLGAKVTYVVPSSTPVSAYFEGYIAPSITSFSDIEGLTDFELGVEAEIAPSAAVFVGYNKLKVELRRVDANYKLLDAAHVGLRFSF